jgi:hypothetical protein
MIRGASEVVERRAFGAAEARKKLTKFRFLPGRRNRW